MSLRDAARYLAAQGRNGDSTLVHMTPREIHGMQQLAQSKGGSLTINPHTGLVEANFFDELGKVAEKVAPYAAAYFLGPEVAGGLGVSEAAGAGIAAGGTSFAMTGSLEKGLKTGLSAYGLAGLGNAFSSGVDNAQTMAANEAAASKLGVDANPRDILMARDVAETPLSMGDTIKAGVKGISALGPKDLLKYGSAVAGPILSSLANKKDKDSTPSSGPSDSGYIRQYYFDPKSQTLKPLAPVRAKDWGSTTFESRVPYLPDSVGYAMGGMVVGGAGNDGMAGGGPMTESRSPYDFQQNNEPVARMADGGTPPQTVEDLYTSILGRPSDAGGKEYWQQQFGDTVDANELAAFKQAAAPELQSVISDKVANIYRTALGRDPDPGGLQYWTNYAKETGAGVNDLYNTLLSAAKENKELVDPNATYQKAISNYTGYKSSDSNQNADEWVRNVLGREVTDKDRQQQWYKDAASAVANNVNDIGNIYGQFKNYATSVAADTTAEKIAEARRTLATSGLTDADVKARTGKTIEELVGAPKTDLDLMHASQLAPLNPFNFGSLLGGKSTTGGGRTTDTYTGGVTTTPATYAPEGTKNPYGNYINPGDITINPDGSHTVTPNIPGRPYGGFTGMGQVRDAYTAGGGKLGQILTPSKAYQNTGMSDDIYKYLMGQGNYPTQENDINKVSRYYGGRVPVTSDPTNKFWVNPKTGLYELNPNYIDPYAPATPAAATETTGANGGLMQAYANGGTTSQDDSNKNDNKTTQGSYEFDVKTGKLKFIPASRGAGDVTGKTQAKIDAFFDNMTPEQQADHQAQLAMIDQGLTPMAIKFLQQLKDQFLYKPENEQPAPVTDMSTFSPGFGGEGDGPVGTVTVGALSPSEGDSNGSAGVGDGVGIGIGIGATPGAAAAMGNGPGGMASGSGVGAGNGSGMGIGAAGGVSAAGVGAAGYALGGISGHLRSPHAFFQNGKYSFHSPQIYAGGGSSNAHYNLGSYSDGGRLLRGPGDGVSDSIPATIGKGQPARLADGEFVVPARIVSEIGNGSTEAGARKLYAMMDRIQAARSKTIGKGKIAKNTRADKYLPK